MITWFLALAITGCTKPGLYILDPIQAQRRAKVFNVESSAKVDFKGTVSDLQLHLKMHYSGESSARVDLSKLWWKVDGVAWQRCKTAKSTDKKTLIFNIKSDETKTFDLVCRDIPRPYERVEVRFHTAGTGGLDVVSLEFAGISQPL